MTIEVRDHINAGFPMAWEWNRKNKKFSCDKSLSTLLSCPPENPASLKDIAKAVAPNQLIHLKEAMNSVAEEQTTKVLNLEFLLEDKRCIAQVMLWSETNNKVNGSLEIILALPSKTEEALLIKDLFERSARAMIILDHSLQVIMVNPATCHCLGLASCELLGLRLPKLIASTYADNFLNTMLEETQQQGFWRGELLMNHVSEKVIAFDTSLVLNRGNSESDNYYIIQMETTSFSVEEIANNANNLNWKWQDKQEFFEQVDKATKTINKDETITVFSLKASSSCNATPALLEWLIAQNLKTTKTNVKAGVISQGIITGYLISSRKVKVINSQLSECLYQLVCERPQETKITIKAEVGVSVLGADASNSSQLVNNSIKAMVASSDYRSHVKESDIDCKIKYYDQRLAKSNDRKRRLVDELRIAISQKHIEAVYQPIVDTKTLAIAKVEALCRITLAKNMKCTTQELIEIAEENDWVNQIDQEVTNQAIRDLPYLEGLFENPDLGVSINRSMAAGRENARSLDKTYHQLINSKIDLSKFTIELTESAIFAEDTSKIQKIYALSDKGVSIAIDDFGTGYTSFSYLSMLPTSIIKIDKSLISQIDENSDQHLMVKMFTDLVHQLNGKVIAEGVECRAEYEQLAKIGVDYIQGYFFSKPKSLVDHKSTLGVIGNHKQELLNNDINSLGNIVNRSVPKVRSDQRLADCLPLFSKSNFVAVVDNSRFKGTVSEADAKEAVSPYIDTKAETKHDRLTLNKRVNFLMTKSIKQYSSRTPIEQVLPFFRNNPNVVIVVEGDKGIYLGVVTIKEVLEYF